MCVVEGAKEPNKDEAGRDDEEAGAPVVTVVPSVSGRFEDGGEVKLPFISCGCPPLADGSTSLASPF